MMRALLLATLLIAAGLAGCLSGDEAATGKNASMPGSNASSTNATQGSPVLREGQRLVQANTSPVEPVRIHENRTIGPGAQSFQISGESYYDERHTYVVSEHLPEGVATRLEVNISWEPPAAGNGNTVYANLDWAQDAVTEYSGPEYDFDTGTLHLSALLQPAGSGEVVLAIGRNVQADDSADASYALTLEITPFTSQIPREAIGAIEVPQGGSLFAEPVDNTSGALLVYDDEDTLVQSVNVTERTLIVANASQATEYVLLPPADDLSARVFIAQDAEAPDPVLRHLPVQWATETITVPRQGSTSLVMEADPPPLRFRVRISPPSNVQWFHTQGGSLHVTGPNETAVLSAEPITCSGTGWCSWMTAFGDAELPAGEYTVTYDSDATANTELEATVAQYKR